MDSVIGMGSPFPWSPGHTWMEFEFFCLKKVSLEDTRKYIYPVLNSDYAQLMKSRLAPILEELNVAIESNPLELAKSYVTAERLDVSLSNVKFLKRDDVSSRHYTDCEVNNNIFTQIASHFNIKDSVVTLIASNQVMHTDYQDYNELYLANSNPFVAAHKCNPETDIAKKILQDGKPLALINIREHTANASSGHSIEQFRPVVSYLNDNGYSVVDMSHESKSEEIRLFCEQFHVFPYWSLEEKSKFADYDLLTNADLFIGAGGLAHLGLCFRLPTIWFGGNYPVHLAAEFGFQLPNALHSKRTGGMLTFQEAFSQVFCHLPELWENKYDCWQHKYGPGNMHNCNETIQSRFTLSRTSGVAILEAAIELLNSISSNNPPHASMQTMPFKDLLGRKLTTLGPSDSWYP